MAARGQAGACWRSVTFSSRARSSPPAEGEGERAEAGGSASSPESTRARPERRIVVAAHSGFLLALFNAVLTVDDPAAATWFGTGEMRAVMLTFTPRAG